MKRFRIEVFPRHRLLRGQRWHFRIRSGRNGQIVASGDPSGYHNRADCEGMARDLRDHLGEADILGAIQ